MVEHLAAIIVIALCCVTVATVANVHSEMVLPQRLDALAERVALNMVRINRADGRMSTAQQMGKQQFSARIVGQKVEVTCDGSDKKWRYAVGLHDD